MLQSQKEPAPGPGAPDAAQAAPPRPLPFSRKTVWRPIPVHKAGPGARVWAWSLGPGPGAQGLGPGRGSGPRPESGTRSGPEARGREPASSGGPRAWGRARGRAPSSVPESRTPAWGREAPGPGPRDPCREGKHTYESYTYMNTCEHGMYVHDSYDAACNQTYASTGNCLHA